jgi:hypothetical protein
MLRSGEEVKDGSDGGTMRKGGQEEEEEEEEKGWKRRRGGEEVKDGVGVDTAALGTAVENAFDTAAEANGIGTEVGNENGAVLGTVEGNVNALGTAVGNEIDTAEGNENAFRADTAANEYYHYNFPPDTDAQTLTLDTEVHFGLEPLDTAAAAAAAVEETVSAVYLAGETEIETVLVLGQTSEETEIGTGSETELVGGGIFAPHAPITAGAKSVGRGGLESGRRRKRRRQYR